MTVSRFAVSVWNSDSYCQYCDWAPACHFQDGRDGDHLRYILPVKPEEFWDELEREDEEGGDK